MTRSAPHDPDSEEPGAEEIRRRFDALVEAAGLTRPGPSEGSEAVPGSGEPEESGRSGRPDGSREAAGPTPWSDPPRAVDPGGLPFDAEPWPGRSRRSRRSRDEDYDPEFHFHPDPPAPLPRHDPGFWATVVGLVGGCLLTLYMVLLHPQAHPLLRWLAGAMVATGFVLLVLRSPTERDEDDDGARV